MQAIIRGDYKFEPVCGPVYACSLSLIPPRQVEYWQGVSADAKSFVRKCLTVDPTNRPTVAELLVDPWLKDVRDSYVPAANGVPVDLLPQVKKAFDARKTCASRSPLSALCYADLEPGRQSARPFWA